MLYQAIGYLEDCLLLPRDLESISQWSDDCQVQLNLETLTIRR